MLYGPEAHSERALVPGNWEAQAYAREGGAGWCLQAEAQPPQPPVVRLRLLQLSHVQRAALAALELRLRGWWCEHGT